MPLGFKCSEYSRRCYIVSSFLELAMEKENIYVLHTGQVYGWDREPAVNQIVKKDGVHLNNDAERRAKRIITERIDRFQHVPEPTESASGSNAGANKADAAEDKLMPSQYLTEFLSNMYEYAYVKPVTKPAFRY